MFHPASHSGRIRTSVAGVLWFLWFTVLTDIFVVAFNLSHIVFYILCFDIDSNNSPIYYFNYLKQLNKQEIISLLQFPLQRLLAVFLLHQTLIKS